MLLARLAALVSKPSLHQFHPLNHHRNLQASLASKALVVTKATMANVARKATTARVVRTASLARRARSALLDCKAHKERKASRVPPVHRVRQR